MSCPQSLPIEYLLNCLGIIWAITELHRTRERNGIGAVTYNFQCRKTSRGETMFVRNEFILRPCFRGACCPTTAAAGRPAAGRAAVEASGSTWTARASLPAPLTPPCWCCTSPMGRRRGYECSLTLPPPRWSSGR